MLDIIKGFTEQVTEYSTILGQIWYLCVFLFRGMVVVTIGGDVYSDEQSEFKCSTIEVGCENVCFAKFSKISHIRFWAFQLLAVSTPTILFHFFVVGAQARIEKVMACVSNNGSDNDNWQSPESYDQNGKRTKRNLKKRARGVRFKSVYDATSKNLKDIAVTDSIYGAYYANVICRAIIEGIFIYLSYGLFKFMNHTDTSNGYGVFDFVWFSVPTLFKCEGEDISAACHQHTSFGPGGYVPCWVSRPWEKTIFLRYMNILSCVCFVLSILEFIYLSLRGTRSANKRWHKRRNKPTSRFYDCGAMKNLAVPIRLSEVITYNDDRKISVDINEEEDGKVFRRTEV